MLTLNKINDIINSRKKTKFKKVVIKMEKYEIVKDMVIEYNGKTLYRIRALKNFDDIKTGNLGGYVESYNNLSQKDNCWIYKNAKVYGNAKVFENAKVYDYAEIYDNAEVYGSAKVFGAAKVYDNTIIGKVNLIRYLRYKIQFAIN